MTIDERLSSLRDLAQWIDMNTRNLEIPNDDRKKQIASGCFDVAIEHQAAIILLGQAQLYGSMHAMMRILVEATVRGLWIWHSASEAEVEKFTKGKIDKSFANMASAIEQSIGAELPTLSMMVNKAWDALNDFTHTGFMQVTRRHRKGALGANYSEDDIEKCFGAAAAYGLIASASLASMAQQDALVHEHLKKMEYWR